LFVNGILFWILFSQGGHERCAPLSYMVDIWEVLYMISRILCCCLFIWFCNILLIVLDLLVKYPAGSTKNPTSRDSTAQRIGGNLIRRRAPGSRTRVPPLRVRPWRLNFSTYCHGLWFHEFISHECKRCKLLSLTLHRYVITEWVSCRRNFYVICNVCKEHLNEFCISFNKHSIKLHCLPRMTCIHVWGNKT
jgi:hypothetical protein